MHTAVLTTMALVMAFTDDFLSVTATQVNLTAVTPEAKSPKSIQLSHHEQRNIFQNPNSDDYNMYLTLMSDAIMGTSPSIGIDSKEYLSLTTITPNFVTRSRSNPPFYASKEEQEMEFEEDSNPDPFFNREFSKWNRYTFCFLSYIWCHTISTSLLVMMKYKTNILLLHLRF